MREIHLTPEKIITMVVVVVNNLQELQELQVTALEI